ncbi:response regulator [Phosphitispora sp. TUW77]|uniref:response regulator n=1 Tax=Phosphitispora sp. TUW77 TaxID=3152361 RepID=UPI003AB4E192
MESHRLNVLIVDDQAGVRYLLDAIVREEGHKPFLAVNGQEAVEQAKKINPNLVFMDIRMPVMDGTKALEKMKEMGCSCSVVIMTAFTEKEVIDKARTNGALKCIIKPFDVGEIRQIIHEVSQKLLPKASAI